MKVKSEGFMNELTILKFSLSTDICYDITMPMKTFVNFSISKSTSLANYTLTRMPYK